jgi:hypothetical protein
VRLASLLTELQTAPPVISSPAAASASAGDPTAGGPAAGGTAAGESAAQQIQAGGLIGKLLAGAGLVKLTAAAILVLGAVVATLALVNPREPDPEPAPPAAQAPAETTAPSSAAEAPQLGAQDQMDVVHSATGQFSAAEIGAPLTPCQGAAGGEGCAPASSAADLALPDGARVTYATLLWAASRPGEGWERAQLVAPDGTAVDVTAESVVGLAAGGRQAVADVTEAVAGHGAGTWQLAGVVLAPGDAGDSAAWSLAVVYTAPQLDPDVRATVYRGTLNVGPGEAEDLRLDIPATGADRIGLVVWGADPAKAGDDVWMVDANSVSGISQGLSVGGAFGGQAAGYSGPPLAGVDVVSFGPVVFPQDPDPAAAADEALSFRTKPASDPQSDVFTVAAVTVIAPVG